MPEHTNSKESSAEKTTSAEFFESKYLGNADPWQFATSEYESNRYRQILAALPNRSFHRTFEPGCSVGVLTEQLANVSHLVEAMDISATAVSIASERCRHFSGVTIRQGALPTDIPEGEFDLVVFSEIGYYFDEATLATLARTLADRLSVPGIILAAHWLGVSKDHILGGDKVHDLLTLTFEDSLRFQTAVHQRFEGYRIDSWSKNS